MCDVFITFEKQSACKCSAVFGSQASNSQMQAVRLMLPLELFRMLPATPISGLKAENGVKRATPDAAAGAPFDISPPAKRPANGAAAVSALVPANCPRPWTMGQALANGYTQQDCGAPAMPAIRPFGPMPRPPAAAPTPSVMRHSYAPAVARAPDPQPRAAPPPWQKPPAAAQPAAVAAAAAAQCMPAPPAQCRPPAVAQPGAAKALRPAGPAHMTLKEWVERPEQPREAAALAKNRAAPPPPVPNAGAAASLRSEPVLCGIHLHRFKKLPGYSCTRPPQQWPDTSRCIIFICPWEELA